jgi:hypothetical protein
MATIYAAKSAEFVAEIVYLFLDGKGTVNRRRILRTCTLNEKEKRSSSNRLCIAE